MELNLADTIALLERTPAVLEALLRDLPDGWTHGNEGDNTWSPVDVLGHLIHAERTNWMPRVTLILGSWEARPFEPFDRSGHVREMEGKSLGDLLQEFARVRAASLVGLRGMALTQDDLDRRGLHPALGTVTLSQLLATWAAHDLTHLHQISRVMANQYRDAVGPWTRYLGVHQCAGHGADR